MQDDDIVASVTDDENRVESDFILIIRKTSPTKKTLRSLIKIYLSESTIHGVSYVANENITGYKRKIWIIILCFALIGTIYSAISFKIRSDRSRLTNVLENISYPVYLITFPAITICNNNRINWLKMDDAIIEFLPKNSSNSTIELFKRFAGKLESLAYGKFDVFNEFENSSLEVLDHITMENLSVYLSHDRNDIFETCWIINDWVSCNDTFGKQKTDHGNCYTYNSILTERGQLRALSESFFPTRYSTEGAGTGLKLRINLNPLTKRPGNQQEDGILVIIHVISEWPSQSFFVPVKSERQVILNPTLFEADEEIKRLLPETRQCFFEDEMKHPKFITLPGHKYNFKNCISQCRQKYLLQYCGCSLGIFYPLGNYPDCRPSDMKCLAKNNRVTITRLTRQVFDITYRQVYYGGIAALFLGCSLMSIAELCYYLVIGFWTWIEQRSTPFNNGNYKRQNQKLMKNKF
ncbi:pickpocket protein 19-like [Condylostylus longicornis]|uniref:pickpocket protein 19-like n=1 Tax=Condylostylus longicornis TaxID=2530218 RepID=UPI00244E232D|nr:pickpocket protein 19-like [Condylostylus longicornis]